MFNSMHLSLLSALVLLLSCIAGSAVAHRNEVKRMAYHTVKEVVLPGSKPMHEIYCPAGKFGTAFPCWTEMNGFHLTV